MIAFVQTVKRLLWDVWLVPVNYLFDLLKKKNSDELAVQDLHEQGLHISKNLIPNEILTCLNEVYKDLKLIEDVSDSGQSTGRISKNGILDDRLSNLVESMRVTASSYLSVKKAHLELTYFQTSKSRSDINDIPGGEFHIDDNKANVKFFIYLSDVSKNNGPFVVVPKTHQWKDPGRITRALSFALTKNEPTYLYHSGDKQSLEDNAVHINGKAGTLFIADTTAWHRAEPVRDGYRDIFVASFNR